MAARASGADDSNFYSKNEKGETVWTLTEYLHGTTPEVRNLLNRDVDRLDTAIKETTHDIDALKTDMAPRQQRIVEATRAADQYKELAAQMRQADADRKASEGLDKLDASSRFNKARLALQKMEHDAVMLDVKLADDETELAADQQQLVQHKAALLKAKQWRGQLLIAIRSTFELKAPLEVGESGLVTNVKVVALRPDGPVGEFYAEIPGTGTHAKNAEGIETSVVETLRVYLLLSGASAVKVGHMLALNQTFEVQKMTDDPKFENVFLMKPVSTEVDKLLEGMPTDDTAQPTTRESR